MFIESKDALKQALLQRMHAYLPEWKGDDDLGMALVEIFADMHADTLKSYQKLRDKWCIDALNCLNTSLQPKTPSRGYVCFGLSSDDVGGVAATAGLLLRCTESFEDGSPIPIETLDDVYVTPSKLVDVFQSKDDYITALQPQDGFAIFSDRMPNLQQHTLSLSHPVVLNIQQYGQVSLTFFEQQDVCIPKSLLQQCLTQMSFSYSTEEGFVPIEQVRVQGDCLVFTFNQEDAPFAPCLLDGVNDYWLQCHVNQAQGLFDLRLRDIRLSARANLLPPDNINANALQIPAGEKFYPFDERPSIYNEVYFGSNETLSKKDALVEVSFLLEFSEVLLEVETPSQTDWKLVMPRSQVKIEKEHDIMITEVVFEYFNGNGFVNLFDHREYNTIFNIDQGAGKRMHKLRFTCPSDMARHIVGGIEGYYIRARILKMANTLKTNGKYVTPVLSQLSFSYQYLHRGVRPIYIAEENNLQQEHKLSQYYLDHVNPYQPIRDTDDQHHALYLGFDQPLHEGPVRLLIDLMKKDDPLTLDLSWQYLSPFGFQPLHVMDETANFKYTGLVSFQGMPDHQHKSLFGKDCYWMRVVDWNDETLDVNADQLPQLQGIYQNSVRVMSIQTGLSQQLTLSDYESDLTFELAYQSIYQASVYVNETATLSAREEEQLGDRVQYRVEDDTQQKWVEWLAVEDFNSQWQEKRCYQLDVNKGILTFSRAHMLPAPRVYNGIEVKMSVGGGTQTNLAVGAVNALDLSLSFINQVHNPLPLSGGTNKETVALASARKWAEQKHQFRAVTASDYEQIVKAYSANIHKVKCFSNRDIYGNRQVGAVTLVLLLQDYQNSSAYFNEFRLSILDYLKDKISVSLLKNDRLRLITPQFVRICITADLYVRSFNDVFETKRQVAERLQQFLDPMTGNFSGHGFEIGQLPNRSQIEAVLKEIDQVQVVKNLILVGEIKQGNSIQHLNMDQVAKLSYVLPLNGKHSIDVFVD